MRTVVIGDVHGCYKELRKMLNKAKLDLTRDRLVMIGDYIDRGPSSYEVVQELKLLREQFGEKHVVLLRGNHEQMAIDSIENGRYNWYNGCEKTLESFASHNQDINEYIGFFKSLPMYFEDDFFLYVHAGIRPGIPLEQQLDEDLIWIRSPFISRPCDYEKTVVFGHTPTLVINGGVEPIFMDNKIAIDTGCVYGGVLTALEIIEGDITRIMKVG